MNQLEAGGAAAVALRTLAVSGAALGCAVALGLPLGIALARRRFRGRGLVLSAVNAGMGLPPVVVGLLVAQLLWRSGPLGHLGWMYTIQAMVVSQVLIALPLVVGISAAAIAALPADWALQVRALGLQRVRATWLLLSETRLGLMAAVIAALGSILSEVGAVRMVGGNLAGETRVLTTGIMMYSEMGEFEAATNLALLLLGMTLVTAAVLTVLQLAGRS